MTAPARLDVFAPITKRERDPKTGHLYVYGKITGPDVDRDQQAMDPTWLKTSVPEWFTRGNIREGHDHRRAVGKAVELEEKSDGWYIGAKIVDREAVEKVEEGILTGFSIGIKGPRLDYTKADAPRGLITDGRICETSLVDVPCLSTATIQDHWEIPLAKADSAGDLQPVESPALVRVDGDMSKADGSDTYGLPSELYDRLAAPVKDALAALAAGGAQVEAEVAKADDADGPLPVLVNVTVAPHVDKADLSAEGRRKAAASGAAMPDGSYPIESKADLRKAIRAVGRGNGDHDAIRKHIITRAKALGLEAMVPDNWNADGSVKDTAKTDDVVAKAEEILRQARELAPELAKADDGDGADVEDADGTGEDADETADIDNASSAIAAIARLIISEAEELATGRMEEAMDISLLLDAVRSLAWFKQREAEQAAGEAADALCLADGEADLAKGEGKDGGKLAPPFKKKPADDSDEDDEDDASDEDKPSNKKTPAKTASKADDGEVLLTKADVAELVKAEVAQARAVAEERAEALAADLAKAQAAIEEFRAMPQPGGPVLTRTSQQEAVARKSDADRLRAEADALMVKAERVEDRDLREGYRERARDLYAKADA